jgi:hypothetical protein
MRMQLGEWKTELTGDRALISFVSSSWGLRAGRG